MIDDDFEERKDWLWEMEEVRGGDTNIEDTDDTDDTGDTAGTTDTADTADITDMGDTVAMADTAETADAPDATGTPDVQGTDDTEGTGETPDTSDTADTADTKLTELSAEASIHELYQVAEQQGLTVDDLHNVNVYLFEQVHDEMKALLAEVNYRAMTQRGNEVERNKEFFNAIYRVAARHEDEVLDELGLDP